MVNDKPRKYWALPQKPTKIPGWINYLKQIMAKQNDFSLAPVTSMRISFLAPNGFEYHHYHYLKKRKPVSTDDFYEALEAASENFGLEIDIENPDKQENSEQDN